jgi:hypothetical protein
MNGAIGALVTLGTGIIAAAIVYQLVKSGSQGPTITGQVTTTVDKVTGDLFK